MNVTEAFSQYILEELHYNDRSPKTIVNYQTALASFLHAIPDVPVQFLTYEHIVTWKRYAASRGLAPSYVACNLARLRKVLKYLRKRGYATLDPEEVTLPKVRQKKVNFLFPSQIQDMIDAAETPRDKALIALMFSSGGRISEVLSLNRDSIRDGTASIIGKGDKPGMLTFDPVALRYLDEYLETRTDKLKPLFISGQRRRLGYARANQIFHEVSDQAGIETNVTTHIMRHSFATDLMLNGADIREVQEHLRHKDVSTAMRYMHVTDAHKQASYRKHHTVLE